MLNSLSQLILIFSSVVSVIYQSNKGCNEVLFVKVCLKHLKEKGISENMNEIICWKKCMHGKGAGVKECHFSEGVWH